MKFAKILIFSEGLTGKVKKYPLLVRLAVLSLAVVYPYLCFLGGFPAMDEGVYAWTSVTYSHNLASGQPLAPLQGFALWPLLLAWIPDLPGLSLLWFRLADMLAALLAGWLLCAILEKECGVYANLLALVVLIFLTNHHVIDNGFKNSFFPAWACFFGAIYLILHEKIIGGGGGDGSWLERLSRQASCFAKPSFPSPFWAWLPPGVWVHPGARFITSLGD